MSNNIYDNIYYNLRVLNEYLVNVINATCSAKHRRKYRKRKCYKCGVYGHIAQECENICAYCGKKHGNDICFNLIIKNSNEILENLLPENCKRFIANTLKFPFIGVKKLYPKKIRELERNVRGDVVHNKVEDAPFEWGQVESRRKATVYDILVNDSKTNFYLNRDESEVFKITLLFYIKDRNPYKKISLAPMNVYNVYYKNIYRNILNPDFESHVKTQKILKKETKKLRRIQNKTEKLKQFCKERQENMENKLAEQRKTFEVKKQFYKDKVYQLNQIKGSIINNLNLIKYKKLNDIRRLGRKVIVKRVKMKPNVSGESHRDMVLGKLTDMESKLSNFHFWMGRNKTEQGKRLIDTYCNMRKSYERQYGARGYVGPYVDSCYNDYKQK